MGGVSKIVKEYPVLNVFDKIAAILSKTGHFCPIFETWLKNWTFRPVFESSHHSCHGKGK